MGVLVAVCLLLWPAKASISFPKEKCFRAGNCRRTDIRPLLTRAEQRFHYDVTDIEETGREIAVALETLKAWFRDWEVFNEQHKHRLTNGTGGLVIGRLAYTIISGKIRDGEYRSKCRAMHGTIINLTSPEHLTALRYVLFKTNTSYAAVDISINSKAGLVMSRDRIVSFLSKEAVAALKAASTAKPVVDTASVSTATDNASDADSNADSTEAVAEAVSTAILQDDDYGTKGSFAVKRDPSETAILTNSPKFIWLGEDAVAISLCSLPYLFPMVDPGSKIAFQEIQLLLEELPLKLREFMRAISIMFPAHARSTAKGEQTFNVTLDKAASLKDQARYFQRPVIRKVWTAEDASRVRSFLVELKTFMEMVQFDGETMQFKAEKPMIQELFPHIGTQTDEWIQLTRGENGEMTLRADFGEGVHIYQCHGYLVRQEFVFSFRYWLRTEENEFFTNESPTELLRCLGKNGPCEIRPTHSMGAVECLRHLDNIPATRSELSTCFEEAPSHYFEIFRRECQTRQEACVVTRKEEAKVRLQCSGGEKTFSLQAGTSCFPSCRLSGTQSILPAYDIDARLPEEARRLEVEEEEAGYDDVMAWFESVGIGSSTLLLAGISGASLTFTIAACIISKHEGCRGLREYLCSNRCCSWATLCCGCQNKDKEDQKEKRNRRREEDESLFTSDDDEGDFVQMVEFISAEDEDKRGGRETFIEQGGQFYPLPGGLMMRVQRSRRRPKKAKAPPPPIRSLMMSE